MPNTYKVLPLPIPSQLQPGRFNHSDVKFQREFLPKGFLKRKIDPNDRIVSSWFFRPGRDKGFIPSGRRPEKVTKLNELKSEGKAFEFTIQTPEGLDLNALFFPSAAEPTENTLLFAHGRTGDVVSHYEQVLKVQSELADESIPLNALIFDYRGFGESSKGENITPTRTSSILDMMYVYSYLRNECKLPAEKIMLMGHSTGSAVATRLAYELQEAGENVNSLSLVGAFSNPKMAIVDKKSRFLSIVASPLIKGDLFWSNRTLPNISFPLTVIHGDADDFFTIKQAVELHEASASEDAELIIVPGGDHDDVLFDMSKENYSKLARTFKT